MKKKIIFMFALLLGVGVAFTSCSKEDSKIDGGSPETAEGKQYKVIIPAEKKSTKVVADGGAATFKTTENVYICNTSNGNAIDAGVLHPQSNAAHSNFIGTLTGNYSVGNTLKVLYNTTSEGIADYGSQNGTLEGVVDAGVGTVSVTSISATDGTIQTTSADIENLQSIFKFTFKNKKNGETLNVESLKITSVGDKLQSQYNVVSGTPTFAPVKVYNTTAQSTVYVALRFTPTANDPITFSLVADDGYVYVGTKNAPSSGFATGKFYTSTVEVEEEPFYYYGTANCLLLANNQNTGTLNVSPYKTDHTFKYTGTDASSEVASAVKAELIWEEEIGFITNLSLSGTGTNQTLTVNKGSGMYGNALIGIYDASDNLLWSYHIWAPEENPTILDYTMTNYKLMNMPLGATKSAVKGSSDADKIAASGFCYQWGRKDPLARMSVYNYNGYSNPKAVYDKNGNGIDWLDDAHIIEAIDFYHSIYPDVQIDRGTFYFMIKYTISNPTVFLKSNKSIPNYYTNYSGSWYLDDGDGYKFLWGGASTIRSNNYKSVFDPSPAGYRVPPENIWYSFSTLGKNLSSSKYEMDYVNAEGAANPSPFLTDEGYSFYYQGQKTGPTHFFPRTGLRYRDNGKFIVMNAGSFWASSVNNNYPQSTKAKFVNGLNYDQYQLKIKNWPNAALGANVLCVKED